MTHSIYHLLKNEKQRRLQSNSAYDWNRLARDNQKLPLGHWTTWLILAGRGFGKTRTGAETIRKLVFEQAARRIALIGGSICEIINVMLEGESGIITISPKHEKPKLNTTTNTLIWPNGATGYLIGATQPEKLRGPQFDMAWVDELAKFRQPLLIWEQLMLALRLGKNPRCLVTTTPKPVPIIKKLMDDPHTIVTRGTTFDNKENLSPVFINQIIQQFEATTLGAQELYGELLTQEAGALWQRSMIKYAQIDSKKFKRVVVAVDPAATHHEQSDETGIVVAALTDDNIVFILDDVSGRFSPLDWGQRAVEAYRRYQADRLVAEVNKGGDMVERIVKSIDFQISYKSVRATRGKNIRAEPIAALYEQNRVFHIKPMRELEQQLCEYIPHKTHKSPDRLDALVWAVTELLLVCESNPILKIW
ncbi:MAG: hypothetical protein CNLJKLNK_00315 [Holosporales bacterium]